ncbi:MAG: MaoC family dehydratase, partial [Actinobacteria bacterium]|nr:MaoC family dehydratase [Actinomycetota bacterium]
MGDRQTEKASTNIMEFVVGAEFPSTHMDVTTDMIRRFAAASFDFNPLHLDPNWMADATFGKTKFGSVIGHGLMTYSL